jgi:diguanylate cyclase (GGDEF)-like protein/PAS domain S-box-containing protein
LLGNLALFAVAGVALSQSREQYREQAFLTVMNLSRALEQSLINAFGKVDAALLAVIDEVDREKNLGGIDDRTLDAFLLRSHNRLPESLKIWTANADGLVEHPIGETNSALPPISDRDYFIRLRDEAQAGLVFSGPLIARIGGNWVIVVARRLNTPNGAFAGIVFAPIPLDYLEELESSINAGSHGAVILFNSSFSILARQPEHTASGRTIGSAAASPEIQALVISGHHAARYEAMARTDGVNRTYFYRQLGSYPLYLDVGLADEDYLAAWWHEVAQVGGLVALVSLASLVAAWMISRRWKDRVTAVNELARQEERYRLLFHGGNDSVFVYEVDPVTAVPGHFTEVNEIACQRLGFIWEEMQCMGPTDIEAKYCAPDIDYRRQLIERKTAVVERIHVTKDGLLIPVEINSRMFKLQGKTMVLSVARDITERKAAERRIEHLAYHDPLTGLPNRQLLLDELQRAMESSSRSGHEAALLLLDLDNFKALNDTLGHESGDMLLQQVGQRLAGCVREDDTVARLGGDEFVVMLEDLSENSEAASQITLLGEKILAALSRPFILSFCEHRTTVSIGATLFGLHRERPDELLKRVDIAMYQAKAEGGNKLRFFDPHLQAVMQARAALEADLRQGIETDQLLLFYQSQVNSEGRLIGAEALVRWRHPERGLVSPAEFIPLAEETGLILPLGEWVLKTACAQIVAWARACGHSDELLSRPWRERLG